MTNSQVNALTFLRKKFAPRSGHEVKRDEVKTEGRLVFLILETGLVDDEGTQAEIFARNRRMFMIGPRGGIKTCTKQSTWKHGATWDTYL